MKQFAALFSALDSSTKTNDKSSALVDYFRSAPIEDAAWAVYILSGNTIPRPASSRTMRGWVSEHTGVPLWLLEESYEVVGDLAETLALLLEGVATVSDNDATLRSLIEDALLPLQAVEEVQRRDRLLSLLSAAGFTERFLILKLITGNLRVGVQRTQITRSLAEIAGVPAAEIAHRLMGGFSPTVEAFTQLVSSEGNVDTFRPYPFCLANPIEEVESLGEPSDWLIEWKWDGIRAQYMKREAAFLWSRGEESITHAFPEVLESLSSVPPGTVLDGEVLVWGNNAPLPFAALQKRLGRKTVSKKLRSELPCIFLAYDLLELDHQDIRALPLKERRQLLEQVLPSNAAVIVSPTINATTWDAVRELRATSRERSAEGCMVKALDSRYEAGRKRGVWWKWKVEPFTCDAVLVYAQRGHGRRADLYTDYTFAVWKDQELVPVAKAYSGLTDKELQSVNEFIRANTKEKFGPVRSVTPQMVFELAFDDIRRSSRHKSGIALRFPRIKRIRYDKRPEDADSITSLEALIAN